LWCRIGFAYQAVLRYLTESDMTELAQLHVSQPDVTLGIAKTSFFKENSESTVLRETVGQCVG